MNDVPAKKVIRLDPMGTGGKGLGPWERMINERCTTALPNERRERFFVEDRPAGQLRVAVWECEAYTEHFDAYPFDEFMTVLEGDVTVIDEHGSEEHFEPGDSFFVPRGFKGTWRQDSPMKKYCVILADAGIED